MRFTVSLTGEKAIDDLLKNMPQAVTHATLGAAHMQAAKPLIEAERLTAPEGPTGNLVDSIGGAKVPIKKAEVVGEVLVGPKGRKGRHAHFIVRGTRRRQTKRAANRGYVKPNDFITPSFRRTKGQVENLISVSVGKALLRTMRRYGAR